MSDATEKSEEGIQQEGAAENSLGEHPGDASVGLPTGASGSGGAEGSGSIEEEKEAPQKTEELIVTEVVLGMVPKCGWYCPGCGEKRTSEQTNFIEAIGNRHKVEWSCECGHVGLLERSRTVKLNEGLNRAQRHAKARETRRAHAKKKKDDKGPQKKL